MGYTPVLGRPGQFKTGAKPSPRHKLLAAIPFVPLMASPPQVAAVPKRLSFWGNNVDGDCVTAEEAFKCACNSPEIFIDDQTAIAWAGQRGYLNGATLTDVMDSMQNDGFVLGGQKYDDGPYKAVDYSNETVLQAALSSGPNGTANPVKIGIDHAALPQEAGQQQGWYDILGNPGQYRNLDHCVSIAGYGPAQWLYQQLGVALPPALQPTLTGYLIFTWSSLGFVSHGWIMSTCGEAWVRSPATVIVPAPGPGPGPTPIPGPSPSPLFTMTFRRTIRQGGLIALRAPVNVPAGTYALTPSTSLGESAPAVPLDSPRLGGPSGTDWQSVVKWVTDVVHNYGPLAEPFLDQWIDQSSLPPMFKAALKQVVAALVHSRAQAA